MISSWLTSPIGCPKKPLPEDPQRLKLYKLEREYDGVTVYHKVSVKDLQTVANHACRKWKVKPAKIKRYISKEKICGYYVHADSTLYLNAQHHGQNTATMLHELAHHITYNKYSDVQDHGPEFCYIYACLLASYRIMPFDCFMLLAKKWGVKVA